MPHSNKTLPAIGEGWRDQITKALNEDHDASPEAVAELLRRHVTIDELTRGPLYERVMTLSHLGFNPEQIAEALLQVEEHVRYVLRAARPDTWRIIEEHLDGYTAHEIAKRTKFSATYVYKILKKYQFQPNVRRAPELNSRQEENILRRWREGEPYRQISQNTGATVAQVKYLVKRRVR